MAYANATTFAVTPIPNTGFDLAAAMVAVDVANGNKFPVSARTLMRLKNVGGGISTATLNVVSTVQGLVVTAPTIAVPATTGDVLYPIGRFVEQLRAATNGLDAYLTFSAAATMAVLEPQF